MLLFRKGLSTQYKAIKARRLQVPYSCFLIQLRNFGSASDQDNGGKRNRLKLPPWPTSLPALPSLPSLPELPSLPSLSSLKSLPSMPTFLQLSNLVNAGSCRGCTQNITMVNNLTNFTTCRICAECFCSKCIKKSSCPVPYDLVHDSFKPKGQAVPTLVQPQPVCTTCMPLVVDSIMEQFRRDMDAKYGQNVIDYVQNPHKSHEFFALPTQAPEDTRYRQLLRFVLVAEVVASFTKASMAFKAVKFAYQGNVLINILVQNDILYVLQPVMEALHKHGIVTSPSALLRLYYLGCKHTLLSKIVNTTQRALQYTPVKTGVLASSCPASVLDYLNTYVSAAQFLYIAKLPPPHSENDWSSWYLNKMVRRQQWTVLMCMNETTKLPNNAKCPAFALLARCYEPHEQIRHQDSKVLRKEVVLVIRGSASTMDWSINLEEPVVYYPYHYYDKHHSITTVYDYVHFGMYKAVMSMLDHYNLRKYLTSLLKEGYEIKVVGHSLGAAVSTLLAAELRNSIIQQRYGLSSVASSSSKTAIVQDLEGFRLVHQISAVVFAAPAFLGKSLANAFVHDRLCLNVVNASDPVPRMSHHNLRQLGQELIDFTHQANVYMEEDKADLAAYVATLGKASDIHDSTDSSKDARLERRQKAMETIQQAQAVQKQREANAASNPKTGGSHVGNAFGAMSGRLENTVKSFFVRKTADKSDKTSVAQPCGNNGRDELTIDLTQDRPVVSRGAASSNRNAVDEVTVDVPDADAFLLGSSDSIKQEKLTDLSSQAKFDTYKGLKVIMNAATLKNIVTVTPGPIVHLYREIDSTIKAAVVNHEHIQFQRLELLPHQVLSDHEMATYRSMLHAAKHVAHRHIQDHGKTRKDAHNHGQKHHGAEHDDSLNVLKLFPRSLEDSLHSSKTPRHSSLPADSSTKSAEQDAGSWLACGVCGLDVTWPFILHSEASRALVTNTCSVCRQVVCSVCAPAGDPLPGDGVQQSYHLPDLRQPLPSLGLLSPQRICLHCYWQT